MMRADERAQLRAAIAGLLTTHGGPTLPVAVRRNLCEGYGISDKLVRTETKVVLRQIAEAEAARATSVIAGDLSSLLSLARSLDNDSCLAANTAETPAAVARLRSSDPLPGADTGPGEVDSSVAVSLTTAVGHWWADTARYEVVLAALGAHASVAAAHEYLTGVGVVTASYPQFTRQLRKHLTPAVHASLTARGKKKGRLAYLDASLYMVDQAPYRNARWQADCHEIPVRVIPQRGEAPTRCWQITFEDDATRLVMGSRVVAGRPTAQDVLATLAAAVRGSYTAFGDWIGGLPEVIRWDNGKEFVNEALTYACARLGIAPYPSQPYSPFQKGKIERWQGVAQQELYARLPGAVHGPTTYTGRRPWAATDRDLLSVASVQMLAAEHVIRYNTERGHRALGHAPIVAWRNDSHPVRQAPAELLYPLMLRLPALRKVNKNGVSYGNVYYSAPELANWRDRQVQVRVLPEDDQHLYIFDPKTDAHICDAVQAALLSPSQRREVLTRRNADYSEVQRALRAANDIRADDALLENVRAADADTATSSSGTRRADSAADPAADPAADLAADRGAATAQRDLTAQAGATTQTPHAPIEDTDDPANPPRRSNRPDGQSSGRPTTTPTPKRRRSADLFNELMNEDS